MSNDYEIIIIGGGPAGLTAGIYAARARRRTVLLEKQGCGGQMALTWEVENYPGVEKISGFELGQRMEQQARQFGLEIETADISLSGRMRMIRTHAWKYVEEIDGTCELYDLIHDPYELVNLWNWPEHTAVQQELVSRLGAWKQSLSALAAG